MKLKLTILILTLSSIYSNNCKSFDSQGKCISCQSGYFMNQERECKVLTSASIFNPFSENEPVPCLSLFDNCITCTSFGCTSCFTGFKVNFSGDCEPTDPSLSKTVSTAEGQKDCDELFPDCDYCTRDKCHVCQYSGILGQDGRCIYECDFENCGGCKRGTCVYCNFNSVYKNNICVKCSQLFNQCLRCNLEECLDCKDSTFSPSNNCTAGVYMGRVIAISIFVFFLAIFAFFLAIFALCLGFAFYQKKVIRERLEQREPVSDKILKSQAYKPFDEGGSNVLAQNQADNQ